MYDYQIDNMSNEIVDKLNLPKTDFKKIQKVLKNYWKDQIAIVWTIEDIRSKAEEMNYKHITATQARRILKTIHNRHNAEFGVTWQTIEDEIEHIDVIEKS